MAAAARGATVAASARRGRGRSSAAARRAAAAPLRAVQPRADGPPPVVPRVDERQLADPMGLLLRQRIIFLGQQVDDFVADAIASQLLLLDAQDPEKEIKLFINSPGGSVTAGLAIYDAMQLCRAPVSTVCFGLAASMGAFLLAAGDQGRRKSMPNSRIMIHQPLGGASGQAIDIEIQAREIMHHKANINRILAFHTGQPVEKINDDTDRDRYMSPVEAKNYGLIDEVIGGDDATLVVDGDIKDFQRTKTKYSYWGEEGGVQSLEDLQEAGAAAGSITRSDRFSDSDLAPEPKA